jgi:hypothetical protein
MQYRYPLDTLAGCPSRLSEFAYGGKPPLKKGLLLLACSMCIYFSDIHRHIPLLAPFLALPGIFYFLRGALRIQQFTWTVIENKAGVRTIFIRHHRWNVAEREQFEQAFKDAMAYRNNGLIDPNQESGATQAPVQSAVTSAPQG